MIKVLAVTGYKAHELGIFDDNHPGLPYVKKVIKRRLAAFAEEGLEWVVITGQLGVELWAGEVTLELKERYPELKLAFLTPFLGQEENWNEMNKGYYHHIQSAADFSDSITKRKYENPNQFRLKNQFLLAKCDGLLVLFDEDRGGSPQYIVNEARQQTHEAMIELFLITPYEIDEVVREDQENQFSYE